MHSISMSVAPVIDDRPNKMIVLSSSDDAEVGKHIYRKVFEKVHGREFDELISENVDPRAD